MSQTFSGFPQNLTVLVLLCKKSRNLGPKISPPATCSSTKNTAGRSEPPWRIMEQIPSVAKNNCKLCRFLFQTHRSHLCTGSTQEGKSQSTHSREEKKEKNNKNFSCQNQTFQCRTTFPGEARLSAPDSTDQPCCREKPLCPSAPALPSLLCWHTPPSCHREPGWRQCGHAST